MVNVFRPFSSDLGEKALVAITVMGGFAVLVFSAMGIAGRTAYAAESINVWWPTENAAIGGVQPFKALVSGKPLGDYKMYWSVDAGGLVLMNDNYQDYPHKEASVDLSGWKWSSSGIYKLSFVAKDNSGNEIARSNVSIRHGSPVPQKTPVVLVVAQNPEPVAIPVLPVTPKATPSGSSGSQTGGALAGSVIPVVSTVGMPIPIIQVGSAPTPSVPGPGSAILSGKLYVDPNNPAITQANSWRSSRPLDAALMDTIGAQPSGIWLGGWNGNVTDDVKRAEDAARKDNSVPVFVAYNIPGRDCGSYSAGGAQNKDAYLSWIRNVSAGLGQDKAILILEPDGLASIDCLSEENKTDRYSMLSSALDIFKGNSGTKVYVDAGHSGWIGIEEMAKRLVKAGISKAAGFALNVSNFVSTAENASYGEVLSAKIGGKHFVIDTSRNGSGSNGEWCNPGGRSLGEKPTLSTGRALVDAFLWVKKPGESDGTCNGGPSAGTWWPEYALGLAQRASI